MDIVSALSRVPSEVVLCGNLDPTAVFVQMPAGEVEARATDLLSQLEIKGFIMKPEGTNRWTIYYDRIDAYLGQIRSQSTTPM